MTDTCWTITGVVLRTEIDDSYAVDVQTTTHGTVNVLATRDFVAAHRLVQHVQRELAATPAHTYAATLATLLATTN